MADSVFPWCFFLNYLPLPNEVNSDRSLNVSPFFFLSLAVHFRNLSIIFKEAIGTETVGKVVFSSVLKKRDFENPIWRRKYVDQAGQFLIKSSYLFISEKLFQVIMTSTPSCFFGTMHGNELESPVTFFSGWIRNSYRFSAWTNDDFGPETSLLDCTLWEYANNSAIRRGLWTSMCRAICCVFSADSCDSFLR